MEKQYINVHKYPPIKKVYTHQSKKIINRPVEDIKNTIKMENNNEKLESFLNYCKNYIIDHIEDWEGQTKYACDLGNYLTEGPNIDGSLTYSTYMAKEYIREWWYEAGEY